MTNAQSPESYMGMNALDGQGNKIGSIGQVYLDDETGVPDWVTVNTGLFGTKESFAPLYGSSVTADGVVLPFGKDVVKGSPEIKDAAHLDADEQQALFAYYQQYLGAASGAQYSADTATAKTGGNADGYLTRSEEQLNVGTQRVEAGRAKLRKFVVTEQQSVTVPVSHDEVQVVREPLQPGDSLDGATIGEDSIEVTLMQDKVQVDKEIVGVEKVKLATTTVTEQQQVSDSVRKEQIEVDGDTAGTPDPNARKR